MTSGKICPRFAPSPTHESYLGDPRAALSNWYLAPRTGAVSTSRYQRTGSARSAARVESLLMDEGAQPGRDISGAGPRGARLLRGQAQ